MTKIDVDIDRESVQQELVQAIMDSSLGKEIQESIEKIFEKKGSIYNPTSVVQKAIQSALEQEVKNITIKIIEKQSTRIRKLVEEELTDDVIDRMVRKVLDRY